MAAINNTFIGTSEDASLCSGLALFPDLGHARAGIKSKGAMYEIFNTTIDIFVLRASASASAGFFFGLCGPAYGFRLNAEGTHDGNNVSLAIKNDVMEAGFLFGFNATAGISLNVDRRTISWVWDGWNSGIRLGWESLVNLRFNATFDLVDLFFDLVLYLLREAGNPKSSLAKVQQFTPTLLGSYGFFDRSANQFATDGQLSARPTFAIPINLVSLIPGLKSLNEALLALHGWLSVGPSVGIAIPTSVKIANVELKGGGQTANYNVTSTSGGTVTGTTPNTVPSNPDTLGLNMRHTPGFQLVCGFGASACVLKLFQVGVSTDLSILAVLGITVTAASVDNLMENRIGQTAAGPDRFAANDVPESKVVRFRFAPPAAAA